MPESRTNSSNESLSHGKWIYASLKVVYLLHVSLLFFAVIPHGALRMELNGQVVHGGLTFQLTSQVTLQDQ